jgi:hypothetical protein
MVMSHVSPSFSFPELGREPKYSVSFCRNDGLAFVKLDRRRTAVVEGVASGYWPPPAKRSSGLVSHQGSSPSPSAQSPDLTKGVLTGLLAGLELKLQAAVSNPFFKPRVTLGALAFCGSFLSAPFERAHARDGLSAPRNRPVNVPSVPTFCCPHILSPHFTARSGAAPTLCKSR